MVAKNHDWACRGRLVEALIARTLTIYQQRRGMAASYCASWVKRRWLGEKQRAGESLSHHAVWAAVGIVAVHDARRVAPFSACRRRQGRWRTRLPGSKKPLPERGPPTRGDLRRRQPGRN